MNRAECITVLKEQNLNLIPLKKNEKIPLIPWLEYQSKRYEQNIPLEANLAVICGSISENLVVIDIDTDDQTLVNEIFPDAYNQTLVVKTGKGYHIYVKVPKLPKTLRLENDTCRIDIQSNGTYVVAPTSVHPNGSIYEIVSNTTKISTIDFQQIIKNLENLNFKPNKSTRLNDVEKYGVKKGSRNDSMFKLACRYLNELDEPTAFATLQSVNEKNNPPLGQRELETLFESAKKYADNPEENESSESKTLYDFALSKLKKMVISQNNSSEVYAIIENNSHIETLNLSSRRAIQWLVYNYHNENKSAKIHGDEFYKNVLTTIVATAQMNGTKKENVYTRVALKDGSLYYDLVTSDWKSIRVTHDKVEIIDLDENSPIFRRAQCSYEQIMPKFDGGDYLTKLSELLCIVEEDRQLFQVHLIALLLESIPIPVMVFGGEAGSLKTTATTTVKRIIDPNGLKKEDNSTSMASRNDDLILQLYNRYVTAFDNVTKITQEVSDILCRAITGSSNVRRELYTNMEETILSFTRKIVLNGIVPTLDYPDLQERIISYNRKNLSNEERLTEEEFEKRLGDILPYILGQIFQTIQRAMKIHDEIKNEIRAKTRLADFEIWGEAISRSLGFEANSFVQRYSEKMTIGSVGVKDSYPIVTVIENLMNGITEYEDTATRCFKILTDKAKEIGIDAESRFVRFPKASNQLTKELITISPVLKKLGISVIPSHYTKNDGKYTKNSSIVRFEKSDKISSPSSPHSPPQKREEKFSNNGEDTGEGNNGKEITSSPQIAVSKA